MIDKPWMRLAGSCMLLLAVGACNRSEEPSPIRGLAGTGPLTEPQARQWATSLANQELMKKRFVDDRGRRVLVLVGAPDWDEPLKLFGRWRFKLDQSPGPWARASFDLDGSDPKVRVGYNRE